jgi:hypothetical protein
MTKKALPRRLTDAERALARWVLENGTEEALGYMAQLEIAEATTWECPCGCASLKFRIKGLPVAPPEVHILGDSLVGSGENLYGIFIFSCEGILSGIEVYSMAGEAPQVLPSPEELVRFEDARL